VSQITEEVRARVRSSANESLSERLRQRCGYCQSLQKYVLGILEIEHIIPKAAGGSDEEENLWLACRLCNSYKGVQTQRQDPESDRNVKLFNPRIQKWTRSKPHWGCWNFS
jgi:5-methylcytosine-specific restriction endonuclease McrA